MSETRNERAARDLGYAAVDEDRYERTFTSQSSARKDSDWPGWSE